MKPVAIQIVPRPQASLRVFWVSILALNLLQACGLDDNPQGNRAADSSATDLRAPDFVESENYPLADGSYSMRLPTMREPVASLSAEQKLEFYTGHSFSKNPWVSAPASTTARDGLGPLFSARSCTACHINGGRGTVSKPNDDLASLVIRMSVDAQANSNGRAEPAPVDDQVSDLIILGVQPEPTYGDQLQIKSVGHFDVAKEATPEISWQYSEGQYANGEPYQLRRPILRLKDLGYGELNPETKFSLRIAPALAGMGYIDAIAEPDILARSDPFDRNQDGISGRANRVWDIESGTTVLGRFGWKANQPNVRQQTAAALRNDMGITSSVFPEENCTETQQHCQQAPNGRGTSGVEVDDRLLGAIVLFSQSIALPKRTEMTEAAMQGRALFYQSGCQNCHNPRFETSQETEPQTFAGRTIWPYSDLLLHDMGEALADHRPDFLSTGREWRTAPLWGLATIRKINPHASFLHDGRARNLAEAILWHGGEAEQTKQNFMALSSEQRIQLTEFLHSL